MRTIAIAFSVSLALLAGPAFAKSTSPSAPQTRMQSCAAEWKAMTPDQKKATTYKAYSKTCLSGGASAPAATMAPTPAKATAPAAGESRMASCAAIWKAMTPDQKKSTTYRDYSKTCLSGGTTAAAPAATMTPAPMAAKPARARATTAASAPATGAAPDGATGLCKDGTYTKSKTHSGSCSHHGGVAKWL
jgi:hypothetical protein